MTPEGSCPSTLSFLQAYRAKQNGTISWDAYVHILLARCVGVKHEDDEVDGTYPRLRHTDAFGHMIWHMSTRILRDSPLDDVRTFEAVYHAYRYSTLDELKNKLALLERERAGEPRAVDAFKSAKGTLALLACQDRRPDVLKYLADLDDFPVEATLADEVDSVDPDQDPEIYKVLIESRSLQPVPRADPDVWLDAAADFDRGGRFPVDW